jgi:type II secretory pathway pseudopilin PulG
VKPRELLSTIYDLRFAAARLGEKARHARSSNRTSKIVYHTSSGGFRILNSAFPIGASGLPAFTLVEAVISSMIVAVMLVAGLSTVGASRVAQHKAALTIRGRLLAGQLLSEILEQSYKDPDGTATLGREAGESAATRIDFDDVDDYHGWTCNPPTARDGTALANAVGWTRSVTVQWIDSLDPTQVRSTETNAKRITVTAAYNNVPQMSLVAIRAAR